jgi:N(2)-fixation sustaining protein CowN
MQDFSSAASQDRYISFIGLDCDAKADRMVEALRLAMAKPGRQDPFWDYFSSKLDGTRGPTHDALYHIHSHINDLRDLVQRIGETELTALLESVEIDCC